MYRLPNFALHSLTKVLQTRGTGEGLVCGTNLSVFERAQDQNQSKAERCTSLRGRLLQKSEKGSCGVLNPQVCELRVVCK